MELLLDSLKDGEEHNEQAHKSALSRASSTIRSPKKPSSLQKGDEGNLQVEPKEYTPSSPTSPGPPALLPPDEITETVAEPTQAAAPTHDVTPPTTRLSARSTTVNHDTYERMLLRLIDTPGLPPVSDPVALAERERGLSGLVDLIEQRFGEVMREESRVWRKATRGEDDLVHLGQCSYD